MEEGENALTLGKHLHTRPLALLPQPKGALLGKVDCAYTLKLPGSSNPKALSNTDPMGTARLIKPPKAGIVWMGNLPGT